MRDSEMGSKLAAAKKDESARATTRSINEQVFEGDENTPLVTSNGPKVHMDGLDDDIALRRNTIRKHHEEPKDNEASDVTWRGRITHSTDEPDNNHVLSALNEIKSLMTLSMKPPNLKAFDQVLPLDSQDKYLNTPDVMKKLNHAAHKKRRTGAVQESRFPSRKSAKHVVNSTPHNSTYPEESTSEYTAGFTGKSPYIRVPHHNAPARKMKLDRKHVASTARRHTRKKCVRGHCRQEIFGGPDLGPNPDAPDGAFEELYLGKIKEHHDGHDALPVEFRARDPDYDTLNELDEHAEHEPSHEDHEPSHYPKSHKGTDYVSPYHAQDHDEGFNSLYGDDDHHSSHEEMDHQDVNGFHGEGGSHHNEGHSSSSNNPDVSFEKQFEEKINDKEYNDDGREIHHAQRHQSHRPNHDEYVDEGDHFPHNSDDNVNDLGMYEHGDNMGDSPSENHHIHNNYHEQLGNENENENTDENADENDETPSTPNNYDFDESKEIKDEEHEEPENVHMNGKLKDWYTANAIGNDNATTLDEPVHHAGTGKNTHPENSTEHIESKFENAGEKPLNSSAAEQAISKLNESLAKGLNESTANVISSSNSTAAAANATEPAVEASNSTASLASNATENAIPNDSVENATATNKTSSHDLKVEIDKDTDNSSASIFNLTHDTIQMMITNLEKKVNNSGDLLKQLEDIERKLNSTSANRTTESLKKPLTETEKELLRVTPEDILQTHLPDSDDLGALHESNINLARHLNATSKDSKDEKKNSTSGKGEESEKAYATIGTPDSKNSTTSSHESSNHTDEGSAAADEGSGAGTHLEKHAELMNKTIIDYVYQAKLNSTAVRRNQVDLSYHGGSNHHGHHSNNKKQQHNHKRNHKPHNNHHGKRRE